MSIDKANKEIIDYMKRIDKDEYIRVVDDDKVVIDGNFTINMLRDLAYIMKRNKD